MSVLKFRDNSKSDWQNIVTIRGEKGDSNHPYISLKRFRSYLYEITFDKLPKYDNKPEISMGGCSSCIQDGKLYRNLDWTYANTAEFVVITNRFKGISYINNMNDGELDDTRLAKLPYQICDGVNEDGIMVSTHVLYNDWDYSGSGNKTTNILTIPFLILNNVKSLDNFANKMSKYLNNIAIPDGLANMSYLLHFIVSDGTNTYVIEPPETKDGNYVVLDATDNPKLTNFRWVNRAIVDRSDSDLQMRPTGIERFNEMPCDMSDIKYTNVYESDYFLSDFIGLRGTNKYSTDEQLLAVYEDTHQIYLNRNRDGKTWHTMHSVVYSPNGMESLYVQEDFGHDWCSTKVNSTITEGYIRYLIDSIIAQNNYYWVYDAENNSISQCIDDEWVDIDYYDLQDKILACEKLNDIWYYFENDYNAIREVRLYKFTHFDANSGIIIFSCLEGSYLGEFAIAEPRYHYLLINPDNNISLHDYYIDSKNFIEYFPDEMIG